MQPNMFNVNKPKHEAPLAIGAAIGGLMGAAGIGGLTLVSGLALGALGGTLLGAFNQKAPKMASADQSQQQAAAQTPALPPATPMPAAPMTPVASPVQPGIDTTAPIPQDIPVAERPQEAAEASPPTTEEVARGQLEKKRKGRVSTILTTPQSRLEDGETEGFERLGG